MDIRYVDSWSILKKMHGVKRHSSHIRFHREHYLILEVFPDSLNFAYTRARARKRARARFYGSSKSGHGHGHVHGHGGSSFC